MTPMTDQRVVVVYDPTTNTFSAKNNPVHVYQGVTRIVWTVELAPETEGVIIFGTEPTFRGIDFGPRWPGTKPQGDDLQWNVEITNALKSGEKRRFHYFVNCWYKTSLAAKTAEKKSWDPEVEEEGTPPPV